MPWSRRATRLAGLTLAAALAAGVSPAVAATGADSSQWQHPEGAAVAWGQLRDAGTAFVFLKATEGPNRRDPWFATDWSAARQAGLLHGAYHFARPSRARGSAQAQARAFVRTAGRLRAPGELPPVLDIESSGGLRPRQLVAWVSTWLTTVQRLTGRRPIVYSYPYFWRHAMGNTRRFRNYPLWGACYCSRPTTFGGAWRQWTFWQYSSRGRLPGIPTLVDVNRFSGTDAQLAALANGAPVPAAPPAPPSPPAPDPSSNPAPAPTSSPAPEPSSGPAPSSAPAPSSGPAPGAGAGGQPTPAPATTPPPAALPVPSPAQPSSGGSWGGDVHIGR